MGKPKSDGSGLHGSSLGIMSVLAIAIAAISPTTSVFLVYGAGLTTAGTGIIWAFIIGALIAIGMAFSYAEVGGSYPSAGGAYTIVRNVLGDAFGTITNILFLVLGIVITATILVAAATYLNSLVPGLPVNWSAVAMMVIITILSLERIGPTSLVAGIMLAIELTVILVFTGFALAHPALATNPLSHPVLPSHSGLIPVTFSAILIAVVPALFAFNGYDWPLYFGEEAKNPKKMLARAVLIAVTVSIVVEVLAVIAATLAIRNLGATAAASAPLTYIATSVMGRTGATVLLIGAIIAMFDTGLAGNLAYARIYFASARDRLWPGGLNRFFSAVNKSQVPMWGFIVLGIGNAILCYFASLAMLITFTGVVIVVIYLMVAIAALVSRARDKSLERPWRMPLWPLPPVVAILGVALALTQQLTRDLIITAVIVIVAAVYYLAYLRPRLAVRDAGRSTRA